MKPQHTEFEVIRFGAIESYARRLERAQLKKHHHSWPAGTIAATANPFIAVINGDHKTIEIAIGWKEAMKAKAEKKEAQPSPTPGPWTAHDDDGTLPCILSGKVNRGGNFYVAQCSNFEDARFIVQACNSHEELVALGRRTINEISRCQGNATGMYAIMRTLCNEWETALAKTEGKEATP